LRGYSVAAKDGWDEEVDEHEGREVPRREEAYDTGRVVPGAAHQVETPGGQ
jgi:hypothetical protein